MEGMSIEEIIENLPPRRIKKKADLIRKVILSSLEVSQIIQIRGSLKVIDVNRRELTSWIGRFRAELSDAKMT